MQDSIFQELQLKKLEGSQEFTDASIYTVLLSLCKSSDPSEVFMILHNVSTNLGKREEIESLFEEAKNWDWKL